MSLRPPRQVTLDELLTLLGSFAELVGPVASLEARTIAVRHGERWYNYASSAALLAGPPTEPATIILRDDVALLHSSLALEEAITPDTFRTFMAGWRETLKTESGFQFQGTLYLRRTYSNPGITPYPYWECELSEELPQQPSFGLPEGPFLHHGSGVFAPDLPTLAANWLAAARWRQQTTLSHRYRLLIEDRRARIAGFDAQDNDLLVTTEAITKEPLYCSANATSYAGAVQQDTHLVQAGRAAFHFDFAVQELEIWLTLDDGYPLDNYRESPHAASWGRERSIYARPRAPNELAASSLAAALAAGEGQITEFKPFVRLRPRDSKVAEILETVSAFANAGGGALYLGVNDYGEPLGMARELRRDYGSKCRDDVQCLQDAYVHDMKRLLNEGLTPPVLPEFKWHEMALESVLEVRIPSSDILVSLITSGGVFRRVNATNQKLRPIDALQSPPN